MIENNNVNGDDAKIEMAINAQEQLFGRFDSGIDVKIINLFEQLKLKTPEGYEEKIAKYKQASIDRREADAILAQDKKNEAKVKSEAVEVKTEAKEYTEPNFDIDVDYEESGASFDLVPLPSKGQMYKHKRDTLEVSFLTAIDESLFMQSNLYKTKQILNLILKNKIITKVNGERIDVKELHHGDKNAILLFLRANAIGTEYKVSVTKNDSDEPLYATIDLTKIKVKELELEGDEEGLFDYKFVDSKTGDENIIKFKFFNDYDEESINKRLDDDIEKGLDVDYGDIYRSIQSVVSVNGDRDRRVVEKFVRGMSLPDYRKYKDYVIKNEPGLDFTYYLDKVTDSQGVESSGFPIQFGIGLDFFLYSD